MSDRKVCWSLTCIVLVSVAVTSLAWAWTQPASAVEPVARGPAAAPQTQVTLYASADATLNQESPTTNFGTDNMLRLGYDFVAHQGYMRKRSLVRFDLAAQLPVNAVIDSAVLQLRVLDNGGAASTPVRARNVTSSWAETGVNWNNQPTFEEVYADATIGAALTYYSWTVTHIAQRWQGGVNYGLLLAGYEAAPGFTCIFGSRENSDAPPKLVVTYHLAAHTFTPTATRTPTSTATRTPTSTATPTATAITTPKLAVADSWIDEGTSTANHGAEGSLKIDARKGDYHTIKRSALVRFNLGPLDQGTYVSDARLELYQTYASSSQAYPIGVQALTGNWEEMQVTWANAPAAADAGIATVSASGTPGWKSWDVTGLTREWFAAPFKNAGVLLTGGALGERGFSSREGSNPPRLMITYGADTWPPANPATITSPTHAGTQWSNRANVIMQWTAAQDYGTSGVRGYHASFDHDCNAPAPAVFTTGETQYSKDLADGTWCFHVRTVDWAGNWSGGNKFWGPFYIETQKPTAPTVSSPSHQKWVWSNSSNVTINWSGATDSGGSNVAGYAVAWDHSAATIPPAVQNTTAQSYTATRGDGVWYFHVRTVDGAGNWSDAAGHYGPVQIDTQPPTNPGIFVDSYNHLPNIWSIERRISVTWSGDTDGAGSGVVGYAFEWSQSPGDLPDAQVDTSVNHTSALLPNGEWYLLVRAVDAVGNWNSRAAAWGPIRVDLQEPDRITDLRTAPASTGGVNLQWTAPGDADSGTAGYLIRKSTAPINESNWDSATPIGGAPAPAAPGTPQQLDVTVDHSHYYYAMKTRDRASNISALSNVDNFLDAGFRPQPHGYNFANWGPVQGDFWNWGDLTLADLQRIYGTACVCDPVSSSNGCWPRALILAWWGKTMEAVQGGHCTGLSVTSLRFRNGIGPAPSAFQAGASNTYDLSLANARRHITEYWTRQTTAPVAAAIFTAKQQTLVQTLTFLATTLPTTPVNLDLWQSATAGHSVTPYALQERPDGIWWVWVYDNNLPNNPTVHVDLDPATNTWQYVPLGWGGISRPWHVGSLLPKLGVLAYEIAPYEQPPACPLASVDLGATEAGALAGTGQVWLTGPGHVLITDEQGRRLGFRDSEFVGEIPGASFVSLPGGLAPQEPIYSVPLSSAYAILLNGQSIQQAGRASVTEFGPGWVVSVDDVNVDTSTRDLLEIPSAGRGVRYTAGRSASAAGAADRVQVISQPTLKLIMEGTPATYTLAVEGIDAYHDKAIGLSADMSGGRLVLNNSQGSAADYDLAIERVDTIGVHWFVHRSVSVATGDTQSALFGTWDGRGPITLQVDHGSNGTIDDTVILDNQIKKLHLPLITRGR